MDSGESRQNIFLPAFHDHHFHIEALSESAHWESQDGSLDVEVLLKKFKDSIRDFNVLKLKASARDESIRNLFKSEKLARLPLVLIKSDFHSLYTSPGFIEYVSKRDSKLLDLLSPEVDQWCLFKEKQAFDVIRFLKNKKLSEKKDSFFKVQERLNSVGISGVDDLATSYDYTRFLIDEIPKNDLNLRIRIFLNIEDMLCLENFNLLKEALVNAEAKAKENPEENSRARISIDGFKLFLDGALSSRTAALDHHYSDLDHGAENIKGELIYSDENLLKLIQSVGSETITETQFSFHAIGPAAIRQAIRISEKLGLKKTRIEHVQIISEDILEALKGKDFELSIQPIHERDDQKLYKARLSEADQKRSYLWAELAKTGCKVLIGSDSPVADFSPWLTLAQLCAFSGSRIPFKNAFSSYTVPHHSVLAEYSFSEFQINLIRKLFSGEDPLEMKKLQFWEDFQANTLGVCSSSGLTKVGFELDSVLIQ